jgi:hypothetical protein
MIRPLCEEDFGVVVLFFVLRFVTLKLGPRSIESFRFN